MIIKEINDILDRQCIVSFSTGTPITEFLNENGITAIVRTRVTKSGGFAIFNFEREGMDEEELPKILKGRDVRLSPDAVMVKVDLSGNPFLEAFKTLNRVPSVVVDCILHNGGYYYLYFRFHSSDENKVTRAMRSTLVNFDRFAVRYIGKSEGVISTFREISSAFPLKYVEVNGSVPVSAMNIVSDPVITNLGVNWTRELKYLLEDEIRAVYYDKNALLRKKEDWINEISKEHRIYETAFSNPLIQFFIDEVSGNSVVTLGMPQKLLGKTFSFATVVPEIVLPEFFGVLYKTTDKFKEWELDIHCVDMFENM